MLSLGQTIGNAIAGGIEQQQQTPDASQSDDDIREAGPDVPPTMGYSSASPLMFGSTRILYDNMGETADDMTGAADSNSPITPPQLQPPPDFFEILQNVFQWIGGVIFGRTPSVTVTELGDVSPVDSSNASVTTPNEQSGQPNLIPPYYAAPLTVDRHGLFHPAGGYTFTQPPNSWKPYHVVPLGSPTDAGEAESVNRAADRLNSYGNYLAVHDVVDSAAIAVMVGGKQALKTIKSLDGVATKAGAGITILQQGLEATSDIMHGSPVLPTVGGAVVNSSVIIGAGYGGGLLTEFLIGEAIDPLGGGLIAIGIGALAGYYVGESLPRPGAYALPTE